ncbi:MAG: peptide chain release factor N(5)-glutamine methyltransferase [Acidimicrobiales bacterium]|nr:peptide chain release factor N(5)-glutamine methyltransferase [Acidimicrobiales bacterium]
MPPSVPHDSELGDGGAEQLDLEGTVAWRALYAEAQARLTGVVDSPEVDARRIVEEASGYEGAELYLVFDEPVTELGMAHYDEMIERRLRGEPLQYVLGRWGFRQLDLAVNAHVLIPRPETEQVVEVALGLIASDRPQRVLDLGTGSGAIALSVAAERPSAQVWAVERSPDAVRVARGNLAGIGPAAARVRLVEGSWFDPLERALQGSFDVIISNPPYVAATESLPPVVRDWEPNEALVSGPTGLESIAQILAEAPRWLVSGGCLVIELGATQAEEAVELARRSGFGRTAVHPDLAGRDRALVAQLADGGMS